MEHDAQRVEVVREHYPDVLMVTGDATLDVDLTAAGIERAKGLVTCLTIRMVSMLLRSEVMSFLDVASRSPGLDLRMEQASIGPDSRLAGLTLMDASIPQQTGLLVIAPRKLRDEKHRFVFNPAADTRLDPGDEMIVMGKPEQIAQLEDYVKA